MAAYEVEEGVVSTITGDTLEKARRELSEDPEKRLHAIKELRAAIDRWEESAENEEKLKFTRKDGKFLLRFLRTKKFNVDRSLQLYVNYHKYRYKHSELLGGADGDVSLHHESVEHVLDCGLVTVLDARTVRGEKVLYVRPAYLDLEKISSGDVVKTVLLILDKLIDDEETQVHGFVLLEDLTDVGLYKMMQVAGMEHFKRGVLFELIQESFPGRFKGVHLLNQAWYITIILTIAQPFLKQKMRERIHMHGGDFSSLHDIIDLAGLPAQLGGQLTDMELQSPARLFRSL